MEDNQINGQKISKEAYCPNSFFDNGTISIGEFKTLDDAMNFPIKEIWRINRTEDNKFQSYKSQGSRLLIICSWNRSIQGSLKFVVAVIHKDKVGKVYYWDMNDLPLYPEERKNQYEGSLGDDATYTLYQIANNRLNCNTNMNKKLIRLTESDLHKIVKESVNKILNEIGDTAKGQYMLGRLQGRQMGNGNRQQAMNTQNYANKQLGSRTPQNFQTYDAAETANQMGYNDERNPQHSQDIMNNGGSIGNYQANVRNNYLRGVSKF